MREPFLPGGHQILGGTSPACLWHEVDVQVCGPALVHALTGRDLPAPQPWS
jgi:hypothetical protein